MWELLFFIVLGIFLGVFAGLIPGIHPNLFASLIGSFAVTQSFAIVLLLVAASITNSFASFIPSIFLGAPDSGTELSVLPGHRMLLDGRGYEALRLTVAGGIVALLVAVATLPVAFVGLPVLYSSIRSQTHWILSIVLVYMLWKDRSVWAVAVTFLSGVLGLFVLDNFPDPLFPLLTGLFGMSGLLYSFNVKHLVPLQKISNSPVQKNVYLKGTVVGYISEMLVGLLPGLGASQAAFLAQARAEPHQFLISIGGITTIDAVFSILALWLIGNPRSGIAVAVSDILLELTVGDVFAIIGVMCIAAVFGGLLTLTIGKRVANMFSSVNYNVLTLVVIIFLIVLVTLLNGLIGLLLMGLATVVGLVAITSGVRRSYCMGVLLIPTILFFFGV